MFPLRIVYVCHHHSLNINAGCWSKYQITDMPKTAGIEVMHRAGAHHDGCGMVSLLRLILDLVGCIFPRRLYRLRASR